MYDSVRLNAFYIQSVSSDADLTIFIHKENGARGRIVVEALSYKPEGRGFDFQSGQLTSIDLIFLGVLGHGIYSASTRNEYQKQKNNVSGGRARPVHTANNLPTVCEPIV
jgi:hypothetical protein